MEKVNNSVQVYTQIITFLIIWGLVLVTTQTISAIDLVSAAKKIPQAISIYVLVGIAFTNWIWRWKILQGWLIKLPDLQGTWEGEIHSNWKNDKQEVLAPIKAILVIKQTFLTIQCTVMTAESTSYSSTGAINVIPNSDDLYFTYNYTNRPKATIRDRSAIHDGSASLKIIKTPERCLEGEYFTNRNSLGAMNFCFKSKELAEKFSNS